MVKNSIFKRHQINFQPGSYVTVHLLNVPKSFLENHSPDAPISLYGMFPHEEKVRLYCIQYIALKFCKTLKNRSLSGSMQWFHCCLGLSFHQNIYNTSNQSIMQFLVSFQQMSVLHFALKQHGVHSIKNKDLLTFHVGFRKFIAKPTFSQHTLGKILIHIYAYPISSYF